MQKFPRETKGIQLDAICRASLWQEQLNYGHGTGHGVGAFLSVHEGPNGLSPHISACLAPGTIGSIEPGFYQPGWGGIRIENLYAVENVLGSETEWYGFQPLTYIPFDKHLLDLNRLSPAQWRWLQEYHQTVLTKLSPWLDAAEMAWLTAACDF